MEIKTLTKTELREKNEKERAEKIASIKSAYLEAKDSIVLQDILQKAKLLSEYHMKIAKDGMGYKNQGKEEYHLRPSDRTKEMDRAAGNDELFDYITRQITVS